ncbi:MAG: hypothetical protein V4556_07835 [Bacteroidota bacterium]
MKFIVTIILIALLSFAACLYLPWWSIAIVAFIVAVAIPQRPINAFFTGFIALFLLWGIIAFVISNSNGDVLAHKISLLILKMDNPVLLIAATALIGALVGAFASLAGSYVRKK